jgi:tRNA threonylcarbamoyladenosine biosynthesis protein TsaE
MKKFEVASLGEFHKLVETEITPLIAPRTLFLLTGIVGAGKTELIKTIAKKFNMQDVQSPTFAFHHQYQSDRLTLHHVDLYRLQSEEDLESTGFWDLFEHENDTIFIEWANMILTDAWPWGWKQIQIEIHKISAESRQVVIRQPQA